MVDSAKVRELLDRGLTHYGLGEVSKALEIWNKVLELDPSNVRAREYVRFVNDNWAPKTEPGEASYRPDEGTDPNRIPESDAANPTPEVSVQNHVENSETIDTYTKAAQAHQIDSEQSLSPEPAVRPDASAEMGQDQLRPGEVPLPDESGFVPPVMPLANLWGDLYDFSGSDSSTTVTPGQLSSASLSSDQGEPAQQEPTVPESPSAPPIISSAEVLFTGSEEPTLESSGLSQQEPLGGSDISEESTVPSEAPPGDIMDDHAEARVDQNPVPSGQPAQEPEKRNVEVFMSSTLPPRPTNTEPPEPKEDSETKVAGSESSPFASVPFEPPLQAQSSSAESASKSADSSSHEEEPSDAYGSLDIQNGEPEVVINPTPPYAESDFEEPSALSLVATQQQDSATEVESPAEDDDSHESMMKGARDLLEIDDFSGALEVLEKILEKFPEDQQAQEMKQEARQSLMSILTAKLGDMDQSPEICMSNDEIIWLNLDNRAGFILSLVDGNTSFEDILSLCGLDRLDGMRILAQLLHDKVICVT